MYFFAAIALLAGCSKEVPQTQQPDPDAWMFDVSLPVPVRFDAGGLEVKSAINQTSDLVGKKFAFLAVNETVSDLTEPMDLVFPDNVKALCEEKDGKLSFSFYSSNAWSQKETYYYPMTTDQNYSFYGYYSVAATGSPNYEVPVCHRTADSIYVEIPVGSTDDILWGKAEAEPIGGYLGFNARYVRKTGKMPVVNFQHPAACLSFTLTRKKSMDDEDEATTSTLTLKDVYLDSIPVKARLCLVDRVASREGSFTAAVESKKKVRVDGGQQLTFDASGNGVPVVMNDFFIMPQKDSLSVKLVFEVTDATASTKETIETNYVIRPEDLDLADGFEKGNRYNFNLIVYSPVKIDISAEVIPYEDAFGGNKVYDPDTGLWV